MFAEVKERPKETSYLSKKQEGLAVGSLIKKEQKGGAG